MANDYQTQMLELVTELRDKQQQVLANQAAQIKLIEQQIAQTKASIAESIGLQRIAVERQKLATRLVIPVVLVSIALVGLLALRYF